MNIQPTEFKKIYLSYKDLFRVDRVFVISQDARTLVQLMLD